MRFVGLSGQLQNGFTVPTDPGQPTAVGTTKTGPGDHTLYNATTATMPEVSSHICIAHPIAGPADEATARWSVGLYEVGVDVH